MDSQKKKKTKSQYMLQITKSENHKSKPKDKNINRATLQHKLIDESGIVVSEIGQPSSSPEHIASRFGHRRLPIGHVAHSPIEDRSSLAP